MSIAEFLLARIAEDEADARKTLDYGGGWDGLPQRALAECEAHRHIVGFWRKPAVTLTRLGGLISSGLLPTSRVARVSTSSWRRVAVRRDEPLGACEVRCSRCGKVVGVTIDEKTAQGVQMRVALADPEHGMYPPITCPEWRP